MKHLGCSLDLKRSCRARADDEVAQIITQVNLPRFGGQLDEQTAEGP